MSLSIALYLKETEMVTSKSIDELASVLSSFLREGNACYIGIDGKDGSGKSALVKSLSEKLEIEFICLDDFVENKKGGYVAFLDVAAINEARKTIGCPLIIEGVCLLAAAERIGVKINVLIYVKRMSVYGDWRDREECEPQIPPDKLVKKLEEEL